MPCTLCAMQALFAASTHHTLHWGGAVPDPAAPMLPCRHGRQEARSAPATVPMLHVVHWITLLAPVTAEAVSAGQDTQEVASTAGALAFTARPYVPV